MKIAITADPFIPVPPKLYGGIERIIDQLIVTLQKQGHDVTLFAHRHSMISCKLIPYKTAESGLKNDLLNTWVINKELLSRKFDVVHSFGRLAYLLPQMPLGIPKLMSYQREPTINQIKKAMQFSRRHSIAFTGCSNYISNKIKPYAPAYTIYNGVDAGLYKATHTIDNDAPLVFLGRIEHIKGTHTAIEIATKSNKRLIIAGNIPPEAGKYFDTQVKPFLNARITYIGAVNDAQKNELLGQAAALLMPIHWDEPFGIVMIEAMACGTPVIGFKRGAVPEVIENNVSGYIVSNVDEAVDTVAKLAKIDRSKVRQQVERRFEFGIIAQQYADIYKSFKQ